MPDTENKVLIGELGLDISDVVDAQSTLKTTFSKDFQYIDVETVRFVSKIQKEFGKLDEKTLEQAKALLASAKLAKAQEKQYESLGKAIGELVAHMEAVGKEADVINQIYRMFVPYNQKLADLFNETAKNSFNAARAMEGSAAAQRQLASDTSKANQTLREQNQLLNGQNTPPAPVSKPKPKKDTEQKPTPVSSPAPQVDDAAQSAERLSDAAQDATHSVRTLTDELSKPATSSPAAMAAPVEEVKEQAQKAKKEVLSLGKEIKGIGKKTYNDKELSGLDKSLEQTYASIYGSKGVEKVTKLNYEDVDRSLDSVKKRYEDFFSDIFQMFRNKNLGELGSSISKLMSQTNFENDRYGKAKDWRRELFEGVDPKTFDDYLSKILDGTVSADAVKAFKKRILQIVENANKMRDEIEKNLGESYAAVEEYRSKVKPTKPTEEVKPSEEKKKQNIAIQHLESILKLRKEIASAGNASKPPEEKELQLYEYLANSLILAKRNGDTTFIDEARAKYKALFDEFENAKGIPPLLNLIMDGVDGAENFISGRRVAKAGGRNDKEQREQVTPKKQSSAEAATEHAAALIKKMQQLKDLIQSMGEIPVGTLDYSRAEGQVKQLEAEIRGHYSTLQNQIEGSEEKTKALAAVEINRASILEELTQQQRAYATSLEDIENKDADNSILKEHAHLQEELKSLNSELITKRFEIAKKKKQLHGAEQRNEPADVAAYKQELSALEKQSAEIERQKTLLREKLDLIETIQVKETPKAEEKPKNDKPQTKDKDKPTVEVLETDYEKYGTSSKRLIEVYKTEEQALGNLVTLLKEKHRYEGLIEERKKHGSDSEEYKNLSKQIEEIEASGELTKRIDDASKALEKAHWSLLGTRKAGTSAERSMLKNAIAQQAVLAIKELEEAGIKIETIISRITQTTKQGFRKAVDGAIGSTKRDQAALQDTLFAGPANRRGKNAAKENEGNTKSATDYMQKAINAINAYNQALEERNQLELGSADWSAAQGKRAKASAQVRLAYTDLCTKIEESEEKTSSIQKLEEHRKSILAKLPKELEKANAELEKQKNAYQNIEEEIKILESKKADAEKNKDTTAVRDIEDELRKKKESLSLTERTRQEAEKNVKTLQGQIRFQKILNAWIEKSSILKTVVKPGNQRNRSRSSTNSNVGGSSTAPETKGQKSDLNKKVNEINSAVDTYLRRTGDLSKYNEGSKKYKKAEGDRAAALETIRRIYAEINSEVEDGELKTKALADIENHRAKKLAEIEKNSNADTHKDKKAEDADRAIKAARKQKAELDKLNAAFDGKIQKQQETDKENQSEKKEDPSERRVSHRRKKNTEETNESADASRNAAEAKREEAEAQEKLNAAVEKGTSEQNRSRRTSRTTSSSRRKPTQDTSSSVDESSGKSQKNTPPRPSSNKEITQEEQYVNLLKERAYLLKEFYDYQEKYLKADDKSTVESYKELALLKSIALDDNAQALQAIEKENKALLEQKAVRDAILYVTDTQAIGEQKIANAQKDSGVKEQKAAVDQLSKAYAQFYKVQEEMARTKPDTEHYRNLEEDLSKAQEGILDAISAIDALDVSTGAKEALVAKAQASAEVAKAAKKLRDTTAKEADKQVQKEADAIKAASDAKRKSAEDAKKAREDERKAAEKAADEEVRAYEEAEAKKAAALEKTKKAQQEYNLAELKKRNEERAAYESWWEQALLDQEKEMFDAPEAAVTRIKKAYEELFKVQKRLEAAKEGTAEYDSLAAEEQKAREAVSAALASVDALKASEAAKKALIDEALEAARTTKAYQDLHAARTKAEDVEAKKQKSPKDIALNAIKEEISLTSQLNDLRKRQAQEKSASGRAEYDDNIRAIEQMIAGYREVYTEILRNNSELLENEDILRQLVILEDRIRKGEKDVNKERQKGNALLGALAKVKEGFLLSVGNAAYRMVEDFVEDKIREFWTNGWEYAQSYYDQLNEIRIVTGQTAEEAAQMGKVYRNMAKEMSVSSTEIASAAVEFWRQGLDESEVNSRLKNTTQYAKISGLEFQEAAELVTAATNSMNLDAQRVVDVFAYLGDASASGNPLISHLAQRCA